MARFRYRTCVLIGPWRDSREQAERDATSSKQANPSPEGDGISWVVPGAIESDSEGKHETDQA
jgi:hypothetical protein